MASLYYRLHPHSSDIVMTSGLSLCEIDGNTHCTSFNTSQTIYFQVIAAEGEQKASRALREASEVIAESSSALQLRYLQVRTSSRHTHRIIKRSFGNYPPYYIFLCYYRHLTRSPPKRTPLSFSHCR